MIRFTSIALVATVASAQDSLDERVAKALSRSRPALTHHLKAMRGSRLALVCLAAAHDDFSLGSKSVFPKALRRLEKSNEVGDTYGLALRLMVMARIAGYPDRAKAAKRDARALLAHEAIGGGFGYAAGPGWDLSNTQYAALGLRAAVHLQQFIPRDVWRSMGERVRASQHADGGFGYRELVSATSSMTVAGIAVLELCQQQLQPAGDEALRYERTIADGWRWMDEHEHDVGSLHVSRWLYFHYGLERAAILSSRANVGAREWYSTGAEMLIHSQRRDGGFPPWANPTGKTERFGDAVGTSFAILFLRRRFQRQLPEGPVTPSHAWYCHALPEQADDDAVRAAVAADVARGMRAVPDLLRAMRSELEVRRRAAAMAFIRISGKDFRYHPSRDAAGNAAALRAAEKWWLQRDDAGR